MARKIPASPSLKRKVEQISPRVEIVIACEGRNTEPEYFHDCVAHFGAGMVTLTVLDQTGVPLTVVRAAVEARKRLILKARKDGLTTDCFRVWAVFDKDDFDVGPAMELAEANRIDVAFSNPCFELWPLLHLENYGAQGSRQDVQRRLKELMPTYDHDAGARINFQQIAGGVGLAITRAQTLNDAREAEDCPKGCPSTSVSLLVKKIIENGKVSSKKTP